MSTTHLGTIDSSRPNLLPCPLLLYRRAPLSLLNIRHDQPVELRIAKRTGEKWVRQPSAPSGPFTGGGHRLGSETDPAFAQTSAPAATPAPPTAAPATDIKFEVDSSQPTTNLQIRLRDGSR